MQKEEGLTITEFLDLLAEHVLKEEKAPLPMDKGAFLMKLADDYERMHGDCLLQRRQVARLLHETFVLMGEVEDGDLEAASVLKDLYDCHTCVRHIAQVYVKGIMPARGAIFDQKGAVSRAEAEQFLRRLLHPEERCIPEKPAKGSLRKLTLEQAGEQMQTQSRYIPVVIGMSGDADTERAAAAWTAHFPQGVQPQIMSLRELQLNPYGITPDRDLPVYFVCAHGVQSVLAGKLLTDHGYRQVFAVLL